MDGNLESAIVGNENLRNTAATDNVTIGCDFWGGLAALFNGLIDDVRIYDRALTDTDIVELHQVPEPCTIAILLLGLPLLRKRKL